MPVADAEADVADADALIEDELVLEAHNELATEEELRPLTGNCVEMDPEPRVGEDERLKCSRSRSLSRLLE